MKTLSLVLAFTLSLAASAAGFESRFLKVKGGLLTLRMGIYKPEGPARGDILYFIGFGDRFDNHGPLFAQWNAEGFRVISFDYPSHGGTFGPLNHLNLYNYSGLMKLAESVEKATREESSRPLLLAGWSTGGLLATRIPQTNRHWDRKPQALILFSPGVSVFPFVGEHGMVTQRTLTSNPKPPHSGPIRPGSPLFTPAFSASLLTNAALARHQDLPNLPVLVLTGGEKEDKYVKIENVKQWAVNQRGRRASTLVAVQCLGGFHELDNEPGVTGKTVRDLAARFASSVLDGKGFFTGLAPNGVCRGF